MTGLPYQSPFVKMDTDYKVSECMVWDGDSGKHRYPPRHHHDDTDRSPLTVKADIGRAKTYGFHLGNDPAGVTHSHGDGSTLEALRGWPQRLRYSSNAYKETYHHSEPGNAGDNSYQKTLSRSEPKNNNDYTQQTTYRDSEPRNTDHRPIQHTYRSHEHKDAATDEPSWSYSRREEHRQDNLTPSCDHKMMFCPHCTHCKQYLDAEHRQTPRAPHQPIAERQPNQPYRSDGFYRDGDSRLESRTPPYSRSPRRHEESHQKRPLLSNPDRHLHGYDDDEPGDHIHEAPPQGYLREGQQRHYDQERPFKMRYDREEPRGISPTPAYVTDGYKPTTNRYTENYRTNDDEKYDQYQDNYYNPGQIKRRDSDEEMRSRKRTNEQATYQERYDDQTAPTRNLLSPFESPRMKKKPGFTPTTYRCSYTEKSLPHPYITNMTRH